MIYLLTVTTNSINNNFCLAVGQNSDCQHIKIEELIEFDNINLWFETVKKIFQKYRIDYHYYLGTDEYLSVLRLALPEHKRIVYRKEREDLSLDKLIKKLTNNLIELPSELEHLKGSIFTEDIKIDVLKLIASINAYWVEEKPEANPIFSYYERRSEEIEQPWTPYDNVSLEKVLSCFE